MMTLAEPTKPATNKGPSGAIDALANYWIKKINYENLNETRLVPEYNLEYGASDAFREYLCGKKLSSTTAFELGLRVAAILVSDPLNAEDALRELLEKTVKAAQSA